MLTMVYSRLSGWIGSTAFAPTATANWLMSAVGQTRKGGGISGDGLGGGGGDVLAVNVGGVHLA